MVLWWLPIFICVNHFKWDRWCERIRMHEWVQLGPKQSHCKCDGFCSLICIEMYPKKWLNQSLLQMKDIMFCGYLSIQNEIGSISTHFLFKVINACGCSIERTCWITELMPVSNHLHLAALSPQNALCVRLLVSAGTSLFSCVEQTFLLCYTCA